MQKISGLKSVALDWVTCTFEYKHRVQLYRDMSLGKWREIRPKNSYSVAVANDCCELHWYPEKPELRVMLLVTGEALRNRREAGIKDEELISYCVQNAGKFTRIDVAVDLIDCEAKPLEIERAFQDGKLETNAKTVTVWRGTDGLQSTGTTVYVGSRSSEKFLRIYEKGKQMKTNTDWVRVEIELKGKVAQNIGGEIAKHGLRAGEKAIRDFAYCESVDWYKKAFEEGEYADIDTNKIGRKETDTQRWILETVVPSLDRELGKGNEQVAAVLVALLEKHRVLV